MASHPGLVESSSTKEDRGGGKEGGEVRGARGEQSGVSGNEWWMWGLRVWCVVVVGFWVIFCKVHFAILVGARIFPRLPRLSPCLNIRTHSTAKRKNEL
jgi:hypothetical protein